LKNFDIALIGGGCVGYFAAQCLAHSRLNIALIAPPAVPDNRTTALMNSSVQALKTLGLWEALAPHATPLKVMRLIDDTGALLRAPELTFKCEELELEAFGYNIENVHLLNILHDVKNITLFQEPVVDYSPGILTLNSQKICCALTIAADGGRSFIREKAGIKTISHPYPQVAMTLNFNHSRPHDYASTEFHTPEGPFTLVPMQGNRSSLVWVRREKLPALSNEELTQKIEQQAKGILGKISNLSVPHHFPLSSLHPQQLTAERLALIGEAAHVLPPIGAQGMNLGFRDAAFIAQLCTENFTNPRLLEDYATLRRSDILLRSLAVDSLNRSLLSGFLPVHAFRAVGMQLLASFSPLKQLAMKTGLSPRDLPKIMQDIPQENAF
jgi:2-octaprenyl-6-methoxyphenol hydroxylase